MATPGPWTTSKRRTGAMPAGQLLDISVDNLDEFIAGFDNLAYQAEKAVRPAAQAAAQVFYDEVRLNVSRLSKWTARTQGNRAPGVLRDSIYQVFSKDNSGNLFSTYHVSWNHKKAPHGHLLEYGHMQPYETYVDKRGNFHTKVRPERLKTYLKTYRGRAVPKRLRDLYFIRLPVPRQIPAYPFIRPAMAKAQEAYDKAVAAFMDRLTGSTDNMRMS